MNRTAAIILVLALVAGLGCRVLSPPPPVVVTVIPPGVTVVVTVVPPTPGPVTESESVPFTPTPTSHTEGTSAPMLLINEVSVLSQTVVITFTVAGDGPQALLFDTPELDGQLPTPDSLEAAHFALLDRITRGQVTANLAFLRPEGEPPWVLVFNPQHEPGDYVAPRVEVEVEP